MVQIIYCGTIKKEYLYPIILSVFYFSNTITQMAITNFDKERTTENKYGKQQIFTLFIMSLSESLMLILHQIQRMRSIRISKKKSTENTSLSIHHLEFIPSNKKLKILLIIFVCFLLDIVISFVNLFFFMSTSGSIILLGNSILFLILTTLISIYALNYQYHRHHVLGLIIFFVGVVVNSSVNFAAFAEVTLLNVFIFFISQLGASLQQVTEKYLMDTEFVSPFIIGGFEGVFGVVFIGLSFFVFNNIKCKYSFCTGENIVNLSFILKFLYNNTKYLLAMIWYFVGIFFSNVLRLLTIQFFTPTHRVMADTFNSFILLIIKMTVPFFYSEECNMDYFVKSMIANVIMTIGMLIYFEIVILGLGGFNKNTKSEIEDRSDSFEMEVNEIMKKKYIPLVKG